jgi:two-component system chemotaxis response regulator CheY
MKALVIDDSSTARQAIRFQLMAYKFNQFDEAENAARAMELLRNERYQLITLDLMMPTPGGITSDEVFQKIRQTQPDTPVLIVSSIPYEAVKSQYIEAGAIAYIVKPFTKFSFEAARYRLRRLYDQFR